MDAYWVDTFHNHQLDQKWGKGLFLSIFLHLVIFSLILFVPESLPSKRFRGVVYEVDLVELPNKWRSTANATPNTTHLKRPSISEKASPIKRISSPRPEEKPIVIAKRTVERKGHTEEKPKVSPTKIIDQTLTKIDKNAKTEDTDPIDRAIASLESRAGQENDNSFTGTPAASGITLRIYQMKVESFIKGNWSYPVSLLSPGSQKDLEAVVIVRVKNNGMISKSRFKKRSANGIFDQSVLKAIERSDPLPPFPDGYRKTYDEIEITFNLRDLEG